MSSLQAILNRTKDFDKPAELSQEFGLSYTIECFVCDSGEIAVKSAWPEGWKRVKGYNYTLCPECANRLREMVSNERV